MRQRTLEQKGIYNTHKSISGSTIMAMMSSKPPWTSPSFASGFMSQRSLLPFVYSRFSHPLLHPRERILRSHRKPSRTRTIVFAHSGRAEAASTRNERTQLLGTFSPISLVPKWCRSFLESHALLQSAAFFRSTAIFISVFFILGVRAAAGSQQYSGLPTQLPVFACISSMKGNARVSSEAEARVSSAADTRIPSEADARVCSEADGRASSVNAKVSAADSGEVSSQNADEGVNDGGNPDQKDGKVLEAEATNDVTKTASRGDSSDERAMEDYEDEFNEEYEDEDDDYDEFDDAFVDDERTHTEFSDPQRKVKVDNSLGIESARLEFGEKLAEDKDMEKAFEEWRSTPYKLTVPLRVVGLRGSVPPIWLKDFILSQGKRARTTVEQQGGLREILSALALALEKKQVKPRSFLAADIVTIGDSWLRVAISGGLIEPIENAEQQDWFKRLSPKWQAYVRRDQEGHLNTRGLIWGVPYRWGSMVIAFRKDKLSKNNIPGIEDWKDLWRPELTGKIAMVDSPREVVGAVLKSLGASYNVQDFDKDVEGGKEAVKQQFLALKKQVKVFDSVHYLKALGSDDVWVAVGWSSDVIPVAKRMSNIRVVAPKSGMSLWADLWAIPAATAIPSDKIGSRVYGASPLVHQWFDFCLQPARALPFRQGVFVGASPLHLPNETVHGVCEAKDDHQKSVNASLGEEAMEDTITAADISADGPKFDTNLIEGMAPKDSLEKSEFLEPLSDEAIQGYEWLFSQTAEQNIQRKGVWEVVKHFLKISTSQCSQRG